jgi:hypothetical protein
MCSILAEVVRGSEFSRNKWEMGSHSEEVRDENRCMVECCGGVHLGSGAVWVSSRGMRSQSRREDTEADTGTDIGIDVQEDTAELIFTTS